MTEIEYKTMIFPPDMVYSLDEFKEAVKTREEGWQYGLNRLLKLCEDKELYEYCSIIYSELQKNR